MAVGRENEPAGEAVATLSRAPLPRRQATEAATTGPSGRSADPPVPAVRDTAWPLTPIDRFVLAAARSEGPDARRRPPTRRTLIRRVTFDLTGLPPTPEEVDAFLADDSPDAFAKVVDRLLASPALRRAVGPALARRRPLRRHRRRQRRLPRPARRTATATTSSTPSTPTCRTTEFVREQLAGDLLAGDGPADAAARSSIATGLPGRSPGGSASTRDERTMHLTIEDTIDNLGKTFLGLTLGCARCHDHKFDPISQRRLLRPLRHLRQHALPVPRHRARQAAARLRAARAAGRRAGAAAGEVDGRRGSQRPRRLDGDESRRARRKARPTLGKRRGGERRRLPTTCRCRRPASEGSRRRPHPDQGDPSGSARCRGGSRGPRRAALPADDGQRPAALADWLTDPKNPLTARVMVNRIWQHHFGRGIVADAERLRHPGPAADAPGAARLPGRAVRRGRLVGQGDAPADHAVARPTSWRAATTRRTPTLDPDERLPLAVRPPAARRRVDPRRAAGRRAATLDRTPGGPHPFPPERRGTSRSTTRSWPSTRPTAGAST